MNTSPASIDARTSDMNTRCFGVEIETVGVTRAVLAAAIAKVFVGSIVSRGVDSYKSYFVEMADGRKWRIMGDASLTVGTTRDWSDKCGEVVSPILTAADMNSLQEVVRAVRGAGAKVDASCGVHVHVDARDLTAATIGRLVTDVSNHDGMLDAGLGIATGRRHQWCKVMPENVRDAIIAASLAAPATALASETLGSVWYSANGCYGDGRTTHYHHTRYFGLNLHSLFFRGTVEFRHFNGTLHAGEIKANVMLALAFVARAKTVSRIKLGGGWAAECANVSKAVGHFFYDHALTGAELANVRKHLTQRLTGAVVAADVEVTRVRRPRAVRAAVVAVAAA